MAEERQLTIEEKIKRIKATESFKSIEWDWFPPAQNGGYYFVSYSHKDYKEVFEDIYKLQSRGLNIWYDRALSIGKDWEVEANRHIYDYNCKGVIFYISENSVLSSAIDKEIEFVKKSGKAYLSINLPVKTIEGEIGNFLSAEELLKRLKDHPDMIGYNEKLKTLSQTFNSRVLHLQLNSSLTEKVERIKTSLIAPPIFEFNAYKTGQTKICLVEAVNDINVIDIKETDFICHVKKPKSTYNTTAIDKCALANCRLLTTVNLIKTIKEIKEYAFFGCTSLQRINLEKIYSIGERAFSGCRELKEVNLNRVCILGIAAFSKCVSLTEIKIPKHIKKIEDSMFEECVNLKKVVIGKNIEVIGNNAFRHCNNIKNINLSNLTYLGARAFSCCSALEKITLGPNTEFIGEYAFSECTDIKEIRLPDKLKEVNIGTFYRCSGLNTVTIGANVETINAYAFSDCSNLTTINIESKCLKEICSFALSECYNLKDVYFNGTIKQWEEIGKGSFWYCDFGQFTVHCTDGDTIAENDRFRELMTELYSE